MIGDEIVAIVSGRHVWLDFKFVAVVSEPSDGVLGGLKVFAGEFDVDGRVVGVDEALSSSKYMVLKTFGVDFEKIETSNAIGQVVIKDDDLNFLNRTGGFINLGECGIAGGARWRG